LQQKHEKIMIKKRKKCPPPIRKTNKFKIIIILILTPLVTWYSKQTSNNPWQMRSEYYFENENGNFSMVFFEQNNSKRSDFLRVYLSKTPPIFDTIQLFVSNNKLLKFNAENKTDTIYRLNKYGWNLDARQRGISITCGDTSIIISFDDAITKDLSKSALCDILVSRANAQKIKEERFFFRPKMTIWFSDEDTVLQISNIYVPKQKDKFRVVRNREKLSILPLL
jgi:hypothetical protein